MTIPKSEGSEPAEPRENAVRARENAVQGREEIATSREHAAGERETAVRCREELVQEAAARLRASVVAQREEGAHAREGAVLVREEVAKLREMAIRASEDALDARRDALALEKERDTELRRVEASAHFLAGVLESSHEGYVDLGPTFVTTFVNDAAARMMGCAREDILARRAVGLLASFETGALAEPFERALRGQRPVHVEAQFESTGEAWFDVTLLPHPAGVLIRLRDISEAQKTKLQLAEALARESAANAERGEAFARAEGERARFERLLEHAPQIINILHGPDHTFAFVNEMFCELLPGAKAFVGKPVREAQPELAGQGVYELLDRVFSTGEPFVGREIAVPIPLEGGAARALFRLYVPSHPQRLRRGRGRRKLRV